MRTFLIALAIGTEIITTFTMQGSKVKAESLIIIKDDNNMNKGSFCGHPSPS